MEFATTHIAPRTTLTDAMRKVLAGIRDQLVCCQHDKCRAPAVVLRTSGGTATPLCRQHAKIDPLDRDIRLQREIFDAMRARRTRTST